MTIAGNTRAVQVLWDLSKYDFVWFIHSFIGAWFATRLKGQKQLVYAYDYELYFGLPTQ